MTSASRDASATLTTTLPSDEQMLAAVARSRSLVRPATTTHNPSRAKRRASPAPSPVSAPTPTTTTVPWLKQLSLATGPGRSYGKDCPVLPSAFRLCAAKDEDEVVDGHIYTFLHCDAIFFSGR